jgi:hypothetical protein
MLYFILGLVVGIMPFNEFLQTGEIRSLSSAIAASGIIIISFLCFSIGIILDGINHRVRELVRLVTLGR